MQLDIRNVRTRWINVDKDEQKAKEMVELFEAKEFTDHQRFSAVTGIEPHEGVVRGEEHYRNCAESHFKILEETILKDGKPVLILEDDVEINAGVFQNNLPIPDDADAVYLGTSHGDGNYEAIDLRNGWTKIQRVFSTHAILHLSEKFAQGMVDVGKRWIYEINRPFDVGVAYDLQPHCVVYAPKIPFFYQADSKNTVNKWEHLTKTPLRTKKPFSLGTIN